MKEVSYGGPLLDHQVSGGSLLELGAFVTPGTPGHGPGIEIPMGSLHPADDSSSWGRSATTPNYQAPSQKLVYGHTTPMNRLKPLKRTMFMPKEADGVDPVLKRGSLKPDMMKIV